MRDLAIAEHDDLLLVVSKLSGTASRPREEIVRGTIRVSVLSWAEFYA